MKIVLNLGETITVSFAESDGEINVSYDKDAIRVTTEWPDTNGRQGTIYEEIFNNEPIKPEDYF